MATTVRGITELDRAIKNLATKSSRKMVSKGLAAARRTAVKAAKSKSPSKRVRRYIRGGSTSLFRASKGTIKLKNNSVGNLGFTAVGVPGPYRVAPSQNKRVAPSQNKRAWFVAYSLEKGNPAQRRGRYQRRQAARPFMFKAVEAAGPQIIQAFEAAARQELGL